jgi:serine/threonine protein kinase
MSNIAPDNFALDRNQLFGMLAVQADLIDPMQFVEICSAWAERTNPDFAEFLVERGWLTAAGRADVDRLLVSELKKLDSHAHANTDEAGTEQPLPTAPVSTAMPVQQFRAITTLDQPDGVPAADRTSAIAPIERYRLTCLHATGGLGRVWLVHDVSMGRDVALKELRPERARDTAIAARFLKEARITGQLEHPGIVPIYELGQRSAERGPYYTMRFVRGSTLAQSCAEYHARRTRRAAAPAELRDLLTVFVAVCNAVAYAHSRSVLHRDLKPQNVVLGDFGEVIVLDWGLARIMGQPESADRPSSVVDSADGGAGQTQQGQILGTPAYMAPEQAAGHLDRLGPATDVYGLGAILYEILTGRPPLSGSDSMSVLQRVIHSAPQRPRDVAPGTALALEAVCLKALAKQPSERYASAKELATEVQRWLADEPVLAYRDPRTVRVARWARRHRVLVTGVAVAGMVTLAGLAAVLFLQARSNSQLQAANKRERERFDELQEANKRERERFELAMDAIRTFHTGVSKDVLLKQENLRGLRNQLLTEAADFYRKLEGKLASQNDRLSRTDLGRAYFELGELTGTIGSPQEALEVLKRAQAIQQALAEESETDSVARLDLAASLVASGYILTNIDKPAEALADLKRAREVYQSLARESNVKVRRGMASCYAAIGTLRTYTDKPEESLAAYEQSRAILQELVNANPDSERDQSDLAMTFANMGTAQFDAGAITDALASIEKAREAYQKLVKAYAKTRAYRFGLARAYQALGSIRMRTSTWQVALVPMGQAQAAYEQLVHDYPAVAEYQNKLADTYADVSVARAQLGQTSEALAACEKAREIYQKLADANPSVNSYRFYLADSLCDVGDLLAKGGKWDEATASYQQALTITEALAAANPAITDYRYRLARGLKRLAVVRQRAGHPADAVAVLRRAIGMLESVKGQSVSDLELEYNLACYQAVLAGVAAAPGSGLTPADSNAEAEKSMQHLRQAIAKGFYASELMQKDTDFDALRPREDFKKLLSEVKSSGK